MERSGMPVRCQLPCSMRTVEPFTVTAGLKSLILYVAVPETNAPEEPVWTFSVPAPKASDRSTGLAVSAGTLIGSVNRGPGVTVLIGTLTPHANELNARTSRTGSNLRIMIISFWCGFYPNIRIKFAIVPRY